MSPHPMVCLGLRKRSRFRPANRGTHGQTSSSDVATIESSSGRTLCAASGRRLKAFRPATPRYSRPRAVVLARTRIDGRTGAQWRGCVVPTSCCMNQYRNSLIGKRTEASFAGRPSTPAATALTSASGATFQPNGSNTDDRSICANNRCPYLTNLMTADPESNGEPAASSVETIPMTGIEPAPC